MIDAAYCRMMARYNAWQNKGLRATVDPMPKAELEQDRGAFFGSIFATLNHLLWADQIWLSRFRDFAAPKGGIPESRQLTPTIAVWSAERFRTDAAILRWADELHTIDLTGDLTWYSGATRREMSKPRALCIVHFFNHQAHHRGQVHAMLTAAGQKPQATDLAFMPESI